MLYVVNFSQIFRNSFKQHLLLTDYWRSFINLDCPPTSRWNNKRIWTNCKLFKQSYALFVQNNWDFVLNISEREETRRSIRKWIMLDLLLSYISVKKDNINKDFTQLSNESFAILAKYNFNGNALIFNFEKLGCDIKCSVEYLLFYFLWK